MSNTIFPCRRAATFLHQKPRRRRNATTLHVFSVCYNSSLSRSEPRGQLIGKRLDELFPDLFSPEPRHRDLNLQPESPRDGFPSDLACLRPPVLEFVEQPSPGEDGKVPITQRLKYWQRLASTHYKFYKAGIIKVWQNQKERRKILERLGPTWGRPDLLYVCAMLGREREPKDDAPPKLTRKEYQLCLRTRSDIHRLFPFAIVLAIFGEFSPLVMPLAFIPQTCYRPNDQMKIAQRWCKRCEYMLSKFNDKIDLVVGDTGKEPTAGPLTQFHRYLLWAYTADVSMKLKLLPYIPLRWSAWLAGPGTLIPRHSEILADTVLILREGGFGKLGAEDICEYAMNCGSTRFWAEAKIALKNGVHPANEAMRKQMVPILEQHAKRMLDVDWTRLDPGYWWLQERHVRSGGDPSAPDAFALYEVKDSSAH